jgi:hypothetical protein
VWASKELCAINWNEVEVSEMLYPIISYGDGTEVTASRMSDDGTVKVYIEKFDESKDSFINIEMLIPKAKVISSSGYDKSDIDSFVKRISAIEKDILEYVKEKGKDIA